MACHPLRTRDQVRRPSLTRPPLAGTQIAGKIAEYSSPVVSMAKECVQQAFEAPLSEGLRYEKQMFWSCFG